MANIALNEEAQMNLNMEAMTENTEGHCDEWNVRHKQLLENDQYLNEEQEKIKAPEFTAADTRENIASKEKLPKILGKIARFFSDLKEVAFSGKYSDLSGKPAIVNNNTTTEAGSALDARQANPTIEGTMANQILQLNNDFYQKTIYGKTISNLLEVNESGLYFINNSSEMPNSNPYSLYAFGTQGRDWNYLILAYDQYSNDGLYCGRMGSIDGQTYTFSGWHRVQFVGNQQSN